MLVKTYPHLFTTYSQIHFLRINNFIGILGLMYISKPKKLTPTLQQLVISFMTAYPQSLKARINC
jgi:hypothetical protein